MGERRSRKGERRHRPERGEEKEMGKEEKKRVYTPGRVAFTVTDTSTKGCPEGLGEGGQAEGKGG